MATKTAKDRLRDYAMTGSRHTYIPKQRYDYSARAFEALDPLDVLQEMLAGAYVSDTVPHWLSRDERLQKCAIRLLEIPYTLHGDYVGSGFVGQSNSEAINDEFGDDVVRVHDAFGASFLCVAVDYISNEVADRILEICESLESYPVLDEDHLCRLEMAEIEEQFEDWGIGEFADAIRDKFRGTEYEQLVDEFCDDAQSISRLFWSLCYETGAYPWATSHAVYFDNAIKSAVAAVTPQSLRRSEQ